MKQCPNPNCILYTRLEELPDAYTRCPGCGGQLVDVSMSSGALHTGHLRRPPNIAAGAGQRNLDEEFQEAFPDDSSVATPPPVAPPAPPVPQQYEDEYYPYEDTEQDESVKMQPLGLSRSARIAYVLALLLLLFSCAFFFVVVGTKILSPSAVSGPDATETAVVALRPAVNTPVAVIPTVPESELPTSAPPPTIALPPVQQPTVPAQAQPATATTAAQLPPTQEVPTQVPATQAPPPTATVAQPPQQPQPVAPTAPPAQEQPTNGVVSAQMVTGLGAGEPSGNVTAYHTTDTFTLAVQGQFGPGSITSMKASWYGPDGRLLYEIPRTFTEKGTYYTGFTLRKSTPWLTGDYRVDLHTNNLPDPAYSVTFSVVP
jgi:hypothetical protein